VTDAAPGPVPGAPSDNTTLVDVLAGFEEAGFTHSFTVDQETGEVRCGSCGHVAPASDFVVHGFRRLEGASDPADMVAVLAVSCPRCGRRGTLVVKYGPDVTPGEVQLLTHIRDQRNMP